MVRKGKNGKMMRGVGASALAISLAAVGAAQEFNAVFNDTPSASAMTLGGRPAIDIMPGLKKGLGYPLRYGNVIRGSTQVFLDGVPLKEGQDFSMDYAGGMLYLASEVRPEQSIRVSYRHDPSSKSSSAFSSLPIVALNFGTAGQLNMFLGLAGASRFADGTLMNAQDVGMNNQLAFAGGQLSGLFLVSNRTTSLTRADSASLDQGVTKQGVEGTGTLIMQNFSGDYGGVKISADYQKVDEKFAGFGMLGTAGVDAERAKQLEKEKGLQRMGLGMSGVNLGGLSFTNSYRTIEDRDGKIEYQDYAVKSAVFDLFYKSRSIDERFNRFKDLSEADREQLQKERGIDRREFGGGVNFLGSTLKFSQNDIEDRNGGVHRTALSLDSPYLKASYLDQSIDAGFQRAGNLAEAERGQWAKEVGMDRRELSLAVPKERAGFALSYSQKSLGWDQGSFDWTSASIGLGTYSLEFWRRGSNAGYGRLNALAQPELDAMIVDTLRMYDPKAGLNDKDRPWITREEGMQREFFRVTGAPAKNSTFRFDSIGIEDTSGDLRQTYFDFAAPNLSLMYRRQTIDEGFNRTFDLLESERKLFGNQRGFDRTDASLAFSFGGMQVGLKGLDVTSADGGMKRYSAEVKTKNFELRGNYREVDDSFTRVADVVDPEKDFLTTLLGYRQFDLSFKGDLLKNLKVDAFLYDSSNGNAEQRRFKHFANFIYTPDKATQVRFRLDDHQWDGIDGLLFGNSLMLAEGTRSFGRFGTLTLRHEEEQYMGSTSTRPDRETDYLKYETKLTSSTTLSTEQVRNEFADGSSERGQSYGFGWQVNKRFGFNVSQVTIDREGIGPDLSFQNFAATYDFGNNMKLGYTWYRELNSNGSGKRNYRTDLTNGTTGGFEVGGSYDEKRIDGIRTTALGNFSLKNTKPFNFGLLKNVNLSVGYNSLTDAGVWQRENELASVSAEIWGSEISAAYGQVMLPGEIRAADRTFGFKLDPSGKDPLQLNLMYKVRTTPSGGTQYIKDYDISYKVGDKFKLVHTTDFLPEQKKGDALLGSLLQPTQGRTWAVDYTPNSFAAFRFSFQDLYNLQLNTLARRTTLGVDLFRNTGSPLRIAYTSEQNTLQGGTRKTRTIYEIGFDQKPGPNQTLTFMLGYLDWLDGAPTNEPWSNWQLRLDYQLKF